MLLRIEAQSCLPAAAQSVRLLESMCLLQWLHGALCIAVTSALKTVVGVETVGLPAVTAYGCVAASALSLATALKLYTGAVAVPCDR